MKFVKKKTSEKVITTRTYVVELTENEYNWLISHPNFESYNYGFIWYGNYKINDPYCGVQIKGCNYKNTVEGLDIHRNISVVGASYSSPTLTNTVGTTIITNDASPIFTVKNA
jgi:hypothetical protein